MLDRNLKKLNPPYKFSIIWSLGRFFHRVPMSIYLSVCLSPFHVFFLRPLIGPQITWSDPDLSLVDPPPLWGWFSKYCPKGSGTKGSSLNIFQLKVIDTVEQIILPTVWNKTANSYLCIWTTGIKVWLRQSAPAYWALVNIEYQPEPLPQTFSF